MTDIPPQQASLRASDADRQAAVDRLEQALADGRITAEEFQERAAIAQSAVTTTELRPLLADLPPQQVEVVGQRHPESLVNVLGDVRLAGGAELPRRVGTVLGDVRIDLRGLRTDAERIEFDLWTGLGDVDVILDEGVDGELDGFAVLGNRRIELAPVPRTPGTPRVVVRAHAVIGDLRLRSLAPGEPVSRWRRRRL
ncbi:DUF1707 domain-containing protein [Petropleomorpha daqingensis]|uniref:DUF1707 domain-containing protein n=1 Tax=Petropleomorpha daqingensis TaxID=2026353 RepID=A0A853CIH5_9ACTN|nr:DUF1707 domain-containing protein [Petropleomorpha daqingensis]NYJ06961.1 hypothetical protein [Petropleomorpha daqingensis]